MTDSGGPANARNPTGIERNAMPDGSSGSCPRLIGATRLTHHADFHATDGGSCELLDRWLSLALARLVFCDHAPDQTHNELVMTTMNITKTASDRYHIEVEDLSIQEEVNGTQFLGMASGRTSPLPAIEILRLMGSQMVGYTMTVGFTDTEQM
jgi:hypothetical protein